MACVGAAQGGGYVSHFIFVISKSISFKLVKGPGLHPELAYAKFENKVLLSCSSMLKTHAFPVEKMPSPPHV